MKCIQCSSPGLCRTMHEASDEICLALRITNRTTRLSTTFYRAILFNASVMLKWELSPTSGNSLWRRVDNVENRHWNSFRYSESSQIEKSIFLSTLWHSESIMSCHVSLFCLCRQLFFNLRITSARVENWRPVIWPGVPAFEFSSCFVHVTGFNPPKLT